MLTLDSFEATRVTFLHENERHILDFKPIICEIFILIFFILGPISVNRDNDDVILYSILDFILQYLILTFNFNLDFNFKKSMNSLKKTLQR